MPDRDRLAADLHTMHDRITVGGEEGPCQCIPMADRLIALGWTRLDEERLARALGRAPTYPEPKWRTVRDHAAAIAKAYREDTDAH